MPVQLPIMPKTGLIIGAAAVITIPAIILAMYLRKYFEPNITLDETCISDIVNDDMADELIDDSSSTDANKSSDSESDSSDSEEFARCSSNIWYSYKIRNGLRNAIKYNMGVVPMSKIIGCDIQSFMDLIESQFSESMTWSNYGLTWDIGNINDTSKYNLNNPIEYCECFNHKNLIPIMLDVGDNDKIE